MNSLSKQSAGPRVGVVIRTKDRPLFVTRALHSVLAQTDTRWRVALVNDGGSATELSRRLAEEALEQPFEDGRMIRIDHDRSIGRSDAFNVGAKALDTEFVCCLDDDDTWDATFLETLLGFYDETAKLVPDLGGVASKVTAIREDLVTEDGSEMLVTLGEDGLPHAFRRNDFFLNPVAYATYRQDIYPVQWMLNRETALAVGGFPSAFSVMEDRAFLTRFLQVARVAILDKPLAFHHRRVKRRDDTGQSVAMNTLDNPSYNWRLFSDLAKIEDVIAEGDEPLLAQHAQMMIRAAAATVIKELNDETSGLWHKVNGETMALRSRLDAIDARLGEVRQVSQITLPAEDRRWSLWEAIGTTDIGYPLSVSHAFLKRFSLSMADDQPGLFLYASQAARQMTLQIPDTREFCALELDLSSLGRPHHDVIVELILGSAEGFLFQTALSAFYREGLTRKTHGFRDSHVHSCPAGGTVHIRRQFSAEQIAKATSPKFSIILPRQARNFRFACHDLIVASG